MVERVFQHPARAMNILMLTTNLPVPPNDGGRIRDYNLLLRMARRHQVALLCLTADPQWEDKAVELSKWGVEVHAVFRRRNYRIALAKSLVSDRPFHTIMDAKVSMKRLVAEMGATRKFEVVHCSFLLSMAQYVPLLPQVPARVLDQHNLDRAVWQSYINYETNALRRSLARRMLPKVMRVEERHIGYFDICFSVSEADLEGVRAFTARNTQVALAPNGVDLDYFRPTGVPSTSAGDVVFCASLDVRMNSQAVLHFMNDIWPSVKRSVPEARFWIVGRNPPDAIQRLDNGTDVVVTGTVPDVRPFLERAGVVVCPLRMGGGTKIKVLEAMAMARPVVASPVGCQGLDVVEGENLLIGNTPERFAQAVVRVLRNPQLQEKLGAGGRRLVEERYSWDATWEYMETRIMELLAEKRRGPAPTLARENC